ncbi:MAG: DUF1553 domain-containing protein [Verrucomicrobiales bacterium]|nr:DUF1553 domain-containing protein [Verrucomicrobiales bacterium]
MAVLALAFRAVAALPPEQVQFFERRIRPVLAEHCYECHSAQAKKLKGGLLLDSKAGWQRGGETGEPAIIPGDTEKSLLLRAVRHDDPDLAMPPKKPKLPDTIIADLTVWVKAGAPDPRDGTGETRRGDKSWWSLRALDRVEPPNPPGLPATWSANPIDRFIFAKLAENGLRPSSPADRRALIRRVTYDLTGLPPSPEEVETFQRSADPSAYEKLVDRLLSSPHYGERWGRHWLDVVRFGESRGFERNEIIPNAWPFRDYVIRSFNEDKPFNQFIIEHLAGDVTGKDRPDVEVGVAFLTIGPYDDVGNQDAVAAANIRAATVDDVVSTTGAAFLGLTIGCARCHHHKFDPVPTEDYYRMKAAFDGVAHGPRILATAEERQRFEAAMTPLKERRAQLVEEKSKLEKAVLDRASALANAPVELRLPPSAHMTEEKFALVAAQQVRFTMLSHSGNPKSGVGGRLDEFEVWTAGARPRNVALASNGGQASGAAGNVAKDFDGAYSVDLVNDGKYSARWFVGQPAVLTITLPRIELIDRVVFSHDRVAMSDTPIEGLGPCVTEYEIHVSTDGQVWRKVADSFDRQPFNDALARVRKLHTATADERTHLADLERQLAEVDQATARVPPLHSVWAGNFSQPKEPTVVFKGGDPMKPGEAVKPASLSLLDQVTKPYELPADAPEKERRLALARWLTNDDNPLTARVLANRVWQHHFGVGIVDTPSDFGFLGGKPTHPELLDWLAHRLQYHGWRLKPLHREIVLSQTYRQSSEESDQYSVISNQSEAPRDPPPARTATDSLITDYSGTDYSANQRKARDLDATARLLWRFPPRRLSAEEVRDTMLAVAGKLDGRLGGPGFRLYEYKQDNVATYVPLAEHGPETYRRAVYHQNARASVVDVLSDFDLPDNAFAAPKRVNTTNPLQTLTMLNHHFVLDMAKALSERIAGEAGNDSAAQARRAYALAFQRQPAETELAAAMALARVHGGAAFCRALLNANELIYLE